MSVARDRPGAARLRAGEQRPHSNGVAIRDIIERVPAAIDIPYIAECGLALPAGLPLSSWKEIGCTLSRIDRAYRWWLGDWLAYGESEYGEEYVELISSSGLDHESVRQCKWVSERVEDVRRRTSLSWGHHREVAPLEPDEQDKWLARAEANHWTRQELRNWLRGPKALAEPGSTELDPQPLLRFCQPDLPTPTIVTLMLRVFFPDAETALDLTYGSGNFWDGSAHVDVTGVDADPTRALHGEVDFRDVPYADDSFDVVLFDPPHLADGGEDSIMVRRFGTYTQAELEDASRAGSREAWRVARLGVIVKVTDGIHGQRFLLESDWVREAIGQQQYDQVFQTRTNALVDPKWEEQLSAYNNGSTYLIFRRDGPLHKRRGPRA